MKVYRVEHRETGKGPWTHDYSRPWSLDATDMPTPWNDIWFDKRPSAASRLEWRYAFPDLDRFMRWMSARDCMNLDTFGFVLACYKVPRRSVRCGGEQALFNATRAQRLVLYPLPVARARVHDTGSL